MLKALEAILVVEALEGYTGCISINISTDLHDLHDLQELHDN